MFSVVEEVEGAYYIEIVITEEELRELQKKDLIECLINIRGRRQHISVRLQSQWDDDDEEDDII